jgi:hypothetical protein
MTKTLFSTSNIGGFSNLTVILVFQLVLLRHRAFHAQAALLVDGFLGFSSGAEQ